MTAPERMSRDEYMRRWHQASSMATGMATRFAMAALALAALATFLATRDPLVFLIWGAIGLGAGAIAWGCYALFANDKARDAGMWPSLFAHGDTYREPPTFPSEPKS